jgi:hypothetical protein
MRHTCCSAASTRTRASWYALLSGTAPSGSMSSPPPGELPTSSPLGRLPPRSTSTFTHSRPPTSSISPGTERTTPNTCEADGGRGERAEQRAGVPSGWVRTHTCFEVHPQHLGRCPLHNGHSLMTVLRNVCACLRL